MSTNDLDLDVSKAARCFKRNLPKGSRFVTLIIKPDGKSYCVSNLPEEPEAEGFLKDFDVMFDFPGISKIKVIQMVP
jgi:hypothetical protein